MRAVLLSLVWLSACVGPPAPDAVLCRDVAERLCAAPVCTVAGVRFGLPAEGCVDTLAQRARCDDPDFAFTTPSRSRVLDCRLALVRASSVRGAHPACDDVDEMIRDCPDLVALFGGSP